MKFLTLTEIKNLSDEDIWNSITATQKLKMLEYYLAPKDFVDTYREGASKGNGEFYFTPSDFVKTIFDAE